MGDRRIHVTEAERLRRESQELLAELMAKLHELDVAEGRQFRQLTPEERRRRFKVIRGGLAGGAVTAGAAWLREHVGSTATAMVAGTAVTMLMATPVHNPPMPDTRPPPIVEQSPYADAPDMAPVADTRPDEPEETDAHPQHPVADKPRARRTATPVPEPESGPEPEPDPEPDLPPVPDVEMPSPKARVEVDAPPVAEATVQADGLDVCADATVLEQQLLDVCTGELLGR